MCHQLPTQFSEAAKNVVYLNFRAAQNAFEKKFNETRPPSSGVQAYLRAKSNYLVRALNGKFDDGRFSGTTHKKVHVFTNQELAAVSKILGRSYLEAKIINHRFFGIMGHSVIMKTGDAHYSEAFAGSGESAVFLLVNEISAASPGSLLLLDEPETSLHPGAQRNLQRYLLEQCHNKKLQVVICSHSAAIIEGLPDTWIKVFIPGNEGQFRVLNSAAPHEALHFIGEPLKNRPAVRVEDKLGCIILNAVGEKKGNGVPLPFEIIYTPGGNNQMMQDAVVYSREQPVKNFIIFDSDVKPAQEFVRPEQTAHDIYSDPEKSASHLKDELESRGYRGIRFPQDSNSKDTFQLRDGRATYIKYLLNSVFYFPSDLEEMIWDVDKARAFYDLGVIKNLTFEQIALLPAKKRYVELVRDGAANAERPTAANIEYVHRVFVRNWLEKKDADFGMISLLLDEITVKCRQASPVS